MSTARKIRQILLMALLCLCCAVCFTVPFTLTVPTAENAEVENGVETVTPKAIVLHEDVEKTRIVLSENGKETLACAVSGADTYSGAWQILAPETNKWVNIFGKTQETLTVSYSLIGSMLDESGRAYVRYAFECEDELYTSKPVEIVLSYYVEGEDFEESNQKFKSPSKKGAAYAAAEGDLQTVSIVINYIFDNGGLAFEPYGASIAKGEDFYAEVGSPYVVGYKPYILVDGEYQDAEIVVLDYKNLQENQTVNVVYEPTIVEFKIHHHLQNLMDDDYSLHYDYITTAKGLTNSLVPDGLAYTEAELPGFKSLAYEKLTIAADGSTVIEIRYDRNYYLIDFEMSGGFGVEPVYTRYGATVGVNAPVRPGYLFDGWELVSFAGKTPTTEQQETLDLNLGGITVPNGNLTYRARWITQITNYTMVFWGENADDNKFTYWGYLDGLTAMSGSYVSGADRVDDAAEIPYKDNFTYCDSLTDKNVLVEGDGSTIVNVYYTRNRYTITFKANAKCAIPVGHTHTDDCYVAVCEMAHIHDENCKPELDCTIPEHDQHTAECLICGITEHVHGVSCCGLQEHTHSASCWNNVGALQSSKPSGAPNNPKEGQIYRTSSWGTRYYYIYIKGSWYRYEGSGVSNNDIVKPACGYTTEHTHGTEDCSCKETVHKHSASCYKDTLHTHGEKCYQYNCGTTEHVHSNACYLLNCGIPVNHSHTSSCNSTRNSNTVKLVHRKFQQSLADIWPIVDGNGVTYDGGERWKPSNSSTYSEVLVYISNMPGENFTLTLDTSSYDPYTMQYYMEALPEQPYDVTVDGKNFRLENTIKARYNYLTQAEDFFEIPGFTRYKSSPAFGSNGQLDINGGGEVNFYYTRTVTNVLDFRSNGDILQEKRVTGVMYGASLSDYNFTPDYPIALEPNAYFFDGWYTTPGHYDGTEVNWATATMGAGDMMYYAKWSPVLHEVNVYLTSELTQKIGETQYVSHNNLALAPSQTISNGNYIFQGWFYSETVDGVTTEKAFVFSGIPIKKDLNIYAKWSSHVSVGYTIKYVLQNTGEEIADATVGTAIAGHNKTFYAKAGDELYAGFREGYYPLTSSHTVTMSAESDHEYTFEYIFVESMPYLVRYLDENDNPVATEKKIMENNLSVVTETFVQVKEMMPDAYQKRLVLTASGTDTDNDGVYDENIIVFRYTSDPEHAYYKVVHYIQSVGNEDGYREYRSEDLVGVIGQTYTVSAITMTGFSFVSSKTTVNDAPVTAVDGHVSATLTSDGLFFKLYYDRNNVSYVVRYLEAETEKVLSEEKLGEGIFGEQVVEYAVGLTRYGYELVSENVKVLTLSMNVDLNVIEFYYQEANYAIRYQIVGLSGCATLSISSENVKAVTGLANGSKPLLAAGYHFVGWYADEACTKPVDASWVDGAYKITPKNNGVWENNVTYYVKIDPDFTMLTISTLGALDVDAGQVFMFRVQGVSGDALGLDMIVTVIGNSSTTISGLRIGKYQVTELTNWSFRYQPDAVSKEISLSVDKAKNKLTFSHWRSADKWLDGNASASGKFNG
jgi:uncharacterized repeat protein (TIGR02543 family)